MSEKDKTPEKESVKDKTPEKEKPVAAPVSEEEALDLILKKCAELDVYRRRQSLLACLGVVLIIFILVMFLLNLIGFGESFDRRKLVDETVRVAIHDLAQDHELKGMKEDFRTVFIPALRSEFKDQLKEGLPKMQDAVEAERVRMSEHLQDSTRERILSRLRKAFEQTEARLIAKHGSSAPSSADLEKALKMTEDSLLADAGQNLQKRLEGSMKSLSELNDSFLAFKNEGAYAEYTELPQKEVEDRMLESFLELWIYHINPDRGDLPAAQKGGI